MKQAYFKLPLKISNFFTEENNGLLQCTELESIDQFLELLIMTYPGEHSFDKEFGCRIWELDFENVVSRAKWEEKFTEYIKEAVINNEKRLRDIAVQIMIRDVLREEIYQETVTVRKRVDIFISATVISSNKRSKFGYVLYLGPLSNE